MQAHAFMNTKIHCVGRPAVAVWAHWKATWEMWLPSHFRKWFSKCVLQDGLGMDSLPGPNSVSGKRRGKWYKSKNIMPFRTVRRWTMSWGCSSEQECLPSMHKDPGLVPSNMGGGGKPFPKGVTIPHDTKVPALGIGSWKLMQRDQKLQLAASLT